MNDKNDKQPKRTRLKDKLRRQHKEIKEAEAKKTKRGRGKRKCIKSLDDAAPYTGHIDFSDARKMMMSTMKMVVIR